jgi:hypothetical protein
VSPLWRDEIGIYLAPHKLVLTRLGRGVRPRTLREASWQNPAAGALHWAAPLAALDAKLASTDWQRAVVRLVLADHWVRYAIVPHSPVINGEAERMIQARHVLAGIYGDVVSQWSLTLGDTRPGLPAVACAVPTALLEDLNLVLARYKLPLKSMEPQLVAAYNHWRGRLPDGGAWFVTLEQGTLAAARLVRGAWDRVHCVRIGADWTVELRRLQTFGRLASSSVQEGIVYVDAPAGLREAAGARGDGLTWLEEPRAEASTSGQLEFLRRNQA